MNPNKVTNLLLQFRQSDFHWKYRTFSLHGRANIQRQRRFEGVLSSRRTSRCCKARWDDKEIASMPEIANYDKNEAQRMTNRILTRPAGSMLLKSKLWRSLSKSRTDADMWSYNDDGYNQVDPQQLEALLQWRSTKLSLASISCKIKLMLSLSSKTQRCTRDCWRSSRYNAANANKKKSILVMTRFKSSESSECKIVTGRYVLLIFGKRLEKWRWFTKALLFYLIKCLEKETQDELSHSPAEAP